MIMGVLTAAGLAAYVSSSPHPASVQHVPVPIVGGPPAVAEWRPVFGSNGSLAIIYFVPLSGGSSTSTAEVILSCQAISMQVRVRGFTPDHAWPQPALTTRLGQAERTGPPQVTASGDRPTLGYAFAIADEVLEPLRRGEPISFEFNGASVTPPAIPEAERARFVDRCGALVHPGMRRRGAASARVH